jgi:hypothetical protein
MKQVIALAALSAVLAALSAVLAATPALAADGFYANARYGYTVSYPAELFVAQAESDSGDGAVFKGRGNRAEFRVWANYGAMNMTPKQFADEAEQDCLKRPAAYRVAKANLVAVSCATKGGQIMYEKMLIHDGLVVAILMTYPSSEHARWDKVAARIAGSLKASK